MKNIKSELKIIIDQDKMEERMYQEMKTINVGAELIKDCKAYSDIQLNIPKDIKQKFNVKKDTILRVAFLGVVEKAIEKKFTPADEIKMEENNE